MASKQVQEIKLRLITEGAEGLDKLKSSFRALEKSIGPTDKVIQDARQSIIDFVGSGKQSIQAIQGQIDAFKGLQSQATIGGNVYRQLAGDVNRLSDTLKQLKNEYEEVGRASRQTDAQIAAQFPARRPEAFRQQLAVLNRQLDQLSVSARAYGDALTEITIRETAFGRAQARQQVIAGAQAVGAPLIGAMTPQQQLPNTLAALQLRISELRQDFQNLDRASELYLPTLNEINRLQRELSEATEDGNVDRKEEIRNRIDNYRAITQENAALRERRQIARSVERGRARAAGQRIVEQPMREISNLFQQIGQIGMQPIIANIEMMGQGYDEVAGSIRQATAASNGSISSLQAQRGAWQQLRAQLDPATADFKRASREIEQLDLRLGKLQQTRGRRLSGMQMAQAAGAAISGGIFGGPEGFIGGTLGAVFGGVGGAFAGAAAGAQLGALRQQAGAVAEYTAQLNLAKTTLAQAATSQSEYNRLLQLARSVSNDYAVALRPSIEGLAQIAVAARANNLSFAETEAIYRGIISSGVAFGKSQQDLAALIQATTQVLSKGKVSAEEMSGQIGERLPGAVAKFAAATGRTLPELNKAFEQGEVTIADFVKFAGDQFEEYDDIAQLIAEGPEKAGVRLQIALDNASENFGGFFQRTGAGLQDFLTNMVNWTNENSQQIKQFVTDWVNAGAAIAGVLSKLLNAFGRTFQRIFQFVQANPFLGLSRQIFGGIANATGVSKIFQQGRFTVEDLFPEFKPTQFGGDGGAVVAGGDTLAQDSAKAARAADKAAREAQRQFDEQLQMLLKAEDHTLKKFALEEKIRIEQEKQSAIQAGALSSEMQLSEIANQRLDLDIRATALASENKKLEDLRKQGLAEGLNVQKVVQQMQQNIIEDLNIQYDQQKLNTQEIKAQRDLEKERESLNRALNQDLEDRRYKLGLITKEEYNRLRVERERRRLEEAYGGAPGAGARIETGVDLFRREIDPTFAEGLQSQLAIVRQELDDLTKPINQVVGAANAIGDAFSQSFASVINGSATTQEALASFFQNLANYFLDMAAQIIQKMIVMAILNQIVGLLPGSKGGGSFAGKGYFDPITGKGAAGPNFGLAMGGVVSKNGIEPFAMGGVVNKPTLFKYADGGTGRFGLMGEAGPEAIIPLKRGRDGRLGVAGGGQTSVTVNVDASGTRTQGDDNRGQQLGRAVAAAVQAELVKQKRPGGLLA